ncbi:790_t:CDS:1, partial [Paraglomus occultum]
SMLPGFEKCIQYAHNQVVLPSREEMVSMAALQLCRERWLQEAHPGTSNGNPKGNKDLEY